MSNVITAIFEYYRMYARLNKLCKILNNIVLPTKYSYTIVIGNIRNNIFYVAVDYTLASIFSKLGFDVYILVNDGQLPHHDSLKAQHFPDDVSLSWYRPENTEPYKKGWLSILRRLPAKFAKYLVHLFFPSDLTADLSKSGQTGITFLYYSQILETYPVDTDMLQSRYLQMKSGIISKNVDASHKRYFGGRDFDPDKKQHRDYAELSIKNEIINERVAHYVLSEIKPAIYITLDGIYTSLGTLVDAMKARNIPTLIYQPDGFFDRSIRIGTETAAICNGGDHWRNFTASHYTESARSQTRAFMDNRLGLNTEALRIIDEKWINLIQKKRQMYRKAVAMFPNLTWDGAIRERDTVFDGLAAWMKETVEWIKTRDVLLVIREHPQPMHVYNSFESSLTLLREVMPDIADYENVVLIEGPERVNSYQLVKDYIDCSIVYNGTLGVEIPYMGEPVIIAANSPYSGKGLGYEPRSKDEYFDYVLNVSRDTDDFQNRKSLIQDNALRAAAYQFVYSCYYCPLMPTLKAFRSSNRYWQDWDLNLESLDPGKKPEWQRTIDRFIEPLTGEK